MKLNYYPDTDSLYIDLSSKVSSRTEEVSEGIHIDYDDKNNIVGIDIDNASKKLDMNEISVSKLPILETVK